MHSDYVPSLGQRALHRVVARAEARVCALLGGIGSGKTRAGAQQALALAGRLCPGGTGMIVVPSLKTFIQVTVTEIAKAWPKGCYKIGYPHGNPEIVLRAPGGFDSRIIVRSAQDYRTAEEIRGPTIAWIWCDEVGSWGAGRIAWDLLIGRLRGRPEGRPDWMPVVYLTGSPRWGWLQDVLGVTGRLPDAARVNPGYYSVGSPAEPANAIWIRQIPTSDNIHNGPGYEEFLRGQYGQAFAEQELDGDFVPPSTSVFPNFYRGIHVIPHEAAMRLYGHCRYHLGGVDWGYAAPAALVAGGIDGDGRLVVVREWSEPGKTYAQLADLAVSWGDLGVQAWYVDPENPEARNAWLGRAVGCSAVPGTAKANNAVEAGLQTLRNCMRVSAGVTHPSQHGAPGSWFYVSDQCKGLISDLQNMQYRLSTSATGRLPYEERFIGSDHRVDALRYLAHSVLRVDVTKGQRV